MKEHIVTTYDEDLNSLKSNLTKMGLNVEKQIFQAVDLIKIINILIKQVLIQMHYLRINVI